MGRSALPFDVLAIQGGNNENEDMLSWTEAEGMRDIYLVDYVKLYVDTVQPIVCHVKRAASP